jgi:hypothetical protein
MRPPNLHRDRGGIVADLFQIVGFGLAMTGLGMLSIPIALMVAGVALFYFGGLAYRK